MAREILGSVLPFAVFKVGRLHEDASASRPCPFAVRPRVAHSHHHHVGNLAVARRTAVASHVADDYCPVAERELRPVTLADPDSLGKPEGRI
jgi:hypothetical protein